MKHNFGLNLVGLTFGFLTGAVSCNNKQAETNVPDAPLPTVHIRTEGNVDITSRENYVNATVELTGEVPDSSFNRRLPAQVKGRGQTTWEAPKKPYKIKLDQPAALAGLPPYKEWVLLANYYDRSLLRTAIAFQLSEWVGMPYTPHFIPVEVFLNDKYLGNYQLGEQVEVAPGKVLNGQEGWFLEVDQQSRADRIGARYFHTPKLDEYTIDKDSAERGILTGSVFVFQSPQKPTEMEQKTISEFVTRTENALYSPSFDDPSSGYAAYFDVDALIGWYLVNELTKNNDAAFTSSVYLYKPVGGKLTLGPVWDFDLSMGLYANDNRPEGWHLKNSVWIDRFFDDRAFIDRLKKRWKALQSHEEELYAFIDRQAAHLADSWNANNQIWEPTYTTPTTNQQETDRLKNFLKARFAWLDRYIMDL